MDLIPRPNADTLEVSIVYTLNNRSKKIADREHYRQLISKVEDGFVFVIDGIDVSRHVETEFVTSMKAKLAMLDQDIAFYDSILQPTASALQLGNSVMGPEPITKETLHELCKFTHEDEATRKESENQDEDFAFMAIIPGEDNSGNTEWETIHNPEIKQ